MDAYIYHAVRTPVGTHRKSLAEVRPDDLAALVIKEAVARSTWNAENIDDVIMGCTNQCGEDNRNVARMALLLAGLPVEVPGMTVNRLCGSGLQAVACAAQAIKAGEGERFIAGGVESMTRAPFVMQKSGTAWDRTTPEIADTTLGWRYINPRFHRDWTISLGETAERVAERYAITREDQDRFALESQQRAGRALADGTFSDELVSVPVSAGKEAKVLFQTDEHARPSVTFEALTKLKPAFKKEGTVTAGNSSGINDGAAALVVGKPGLEGTPLARIVGTAVAGIDPAYMGMGPVPATKKVLERTGLKLEQIDLIELNEAFAAQSLACIRELRLDPARVNIYGGAIALGHPLGCTGAKLLVTLTHALRRTHSRYGLVSMCIGVGQGIAMIIERL